MDSAMRKNILSVLIAVFSTSSVLAAESGRVVLWEGGKTSTTLIPPRLAPPVDKLIENTINGYLSESFGHEIPLGSAADKPGTFVVVGNETNNPMLAKLITGGVKLDNQALGEEGFRI